MGAEPDERSPTEVHVAQLNTAIVKVKTAIREIERDHNPLLQATFRLFMSHLQTLSDRFTHLTIPVPANGEHPIAFHQRFFAAVSKAGIPFPGFHPSSDMELSWNALRAEEFAHNERLERLREALDDLRDVKRRAIWRIWRETGVKLDASEGE